ncbi:MAG: bifunctional 4-hydroxy-2-oxoglutarate aldolase/2-dehydro-3-deoxy-phosphogluconate aldolase [bacterium]
MDAIFKTRVMPVVVIDDVELAEPLAETLLSSGQAAVEITFRTPAAADCVQRITKRFPQMIVGAGTLLTVEQVERAVAAGAQFTVAPGLNPRVVERALALHVPMFPGVMTPSEVEQGVQLGCKILKFFPAEAAGGLKMLKSLAGPYAHTGVRFIPLGGVNAANMATYLALPVVAAVGGSWMVERELIAARDWSRIGTLTREALALAKPA